MIDIEKPDYSNHPGKRYPVAMYKRRGGNKITPLISILTPFYHAGNYIEETARSIQSQSLQDWEWIIVDDGSTEAESLRILAKLEQADERIRIIRQGNAGPSAARNTAFRHAKGRFLGLIDADDMIEPTYLEKCVWFLESYPQFAFCNSWSVFFGSKNFLLRRGFDYNGEDLYANYVPPISVIRREVYEASGGFDETIVDGHEDWDFWLAVARLGQWGYTINEYMQWYRKRIDGRFEQFMGRKNNHENFEKRLREKYQDLKKSTFPNPQRHQPQAFEPISNAVSFLNPLASSTTKSGRHILIIITWMVTGGADQVNIDLIKGLIEDGYQVTICATIEAKHEWLHRFAELTPDIFILPNFLYSHDYPRFIKYLIESRNIEIVLSVLCTLGYFLLPYLRAAYPRVTFVDLCHVEELQWYSGGYPQFSIGYQDQLDLTIVTTKHLADWMAEHGADKNRIRVFYTGVEGQDLRLVAEKRKKIRRELEIDDALPVIVFVGRICPQKNPLLLAEILREARDQGLKYKALILGDGEQLTELKALLSKYRLTDQAMALGRVSHDRWLELLAASDTFLLCSEYEGISVALLEAMSYGVVPIVAHVGGHDEVVEEGAGYLVEADRQDPLPYVKVLREILPDPDRQKKMGVKAWEIIQKRFSHRAANSNFMAFLEEAHGLAKAEPRMALPPRLATQLATYVMEHTRLESGAHHLWLYWKNHQAAKMGNAAKKTPLQKWLKKIRKAYKKART